jgi:hypothetical protein
VARDQEFASALVDEQRDGRGLLLEVDEQADRLAVTASAATQGPYLRDPLHGLRATKDRLN